MWMTAMVTGSSLEDTLVALMSATMARAAGSMHTICLINQEGKTVAIGLAVGEPGRSR